MFCRQFNLIYNDDKARFGDPANTDVSFVSVKDIPEWQETVNKHAKAALPVLVNLKKRKRAPEGPEGGAVESSRRRVGRARARAAVRDIRACIPSRRIADFNLGGGPDLAGVDLALLFPPSHQT